MNDNTRRPKVITMFILIGASGLGKITLLTFDIIMSILFSCWGFCSCNKSNIMATSCWYNVHFNVYTDWGFWAWKNNAISWLGPINHYDRISWDTWNLRTYEVTLYLKYATFKPTLYWNWLWMKTLQKLYAIYRQKCLLCVIRVISWTLNENVSINYNVYLHTQISPVRLSWLYVVLVII